MVNGDIAASLGWSVVAATDDKRLGYDNINYVADRAADHQKNGGHPWTSITGRWTHARDIPTNGSNVQADIDNINAKADQGVAAKSVADMARRGDMDIAVWERQLSVNYRAVWMSYTGQVLLGYVPSTRESKQDIREVPWTEAQVRGIPIVLFRYREAVAVLGDEAVVEVGSLAEDLHMLGLREFVDYDRDGRPQAIKYDRLSLAALWLAQLAAARADVLEDRVRRLERRLSALEGD